MSSKISSNILAGTVLELRHVHHISQPKALENTWKETIEKELLHRGRTSRQLPSALMYDEAGLELWAKIVDLPDYYIPSAEMDSLSKWGQGVIEELGEGKALIDLGSGDIRKVIGLLGDFEKAKCRVYYFALDMNAEKLEESMRRIPSSWHHVQPYAICGTFEEARIWAQNLPMPKCFLSLGSTVGNDNPEYMAEELAQW
ncbi:hypothetical protein VPNG_00955 [Cytospora leucostoma]|uniref:Histidine-specific methyltransferase SAM-dependent domain-containing protein n=1 Tax=Cytospora leucostoma TaxID=1230097 RepID=A0A423XN43_9PEZI|nr:hypothetical protein VPNG_00955 [Cytospora leucostoma]